MDPLQIHAEGTATAVTRTRDIESGHMIEKGSKIGTELPLHPPDANPTGRWYPRPDSNRQACYSGGF